MVGLVGLVGQVRPISLVQIFSFSAFQHFRRRPPADLERLAGWMAGRWDRRVGTHPGRVLAAALGAAPKGGVWDSRSAWACFISADSVSLS